MPQQIPPYRLTDLILAIGLNAEDFRYYQVRGLIREDDEIGILEPSDSFAKAELIGVYCFEAGQWHHQVDVSRVSEAITHLMTSDEGNPQDYVRFVNVPGELVQVPKYT